MLLEPRRLPPLWEIQFCYDEETGIWQNEENGIWLVDSLETLKKWMLSQAGK